MAGSYVQGAHFGLQTAVQLALKKSTTTIQQHLLMQLKVMLLCHVNRHVLSEGMG